MGDALSHFDLSQRFWDAGFSLTFVVDLAIVASAYDGAAGTTEFSSFRNRAVTRSLRAPFDRARGRVRPPREWLGRALPFANQTVIDRSSRLRKEGYS
jgi:hypothetical protein